mgnify:FL=1|tara:strand:+ start:2377 stop:2913 length:537 start_codon:yes stop_codon:yes gene_type:complete
MNTISINNKIFEIYIPDHEISQIIDIIADQINKSCFEKPLFISVLNGSFMFASDLMKKINISKTEISFIKLSSYSGTKTSGIINELIGLNGDISNRNIILLEDIIDTGNTLEKILLLLKKEGVASIKIASLLFKPGAYKKDYEIDFIGKSISNNFVVGYGMDFDEIGRNLPHIYKLKK